MSFFYCRFCSVLHDFVIYICNHKPLYAFMSLHISHCIYQSNEMAASFQLDMFTFSSACFMKAEAGMFSSSYAKTILTFSGYSLSGGPIQDSPVSHSLFLRSSTLFFPAPTSAGCEHADMFPLTNIICIQFLSRSIGHKHLLFAVRTLHLLLYST